MLAAVDPPVSGVIVASPANPTGTVIPPQELAAIATWCDSNGVRLISDEVYHGLVYDGAPGVETTAHTPQALIPGMNTFLSQLNITVRRDPTNFRPRINKIDSIKDREQKLAGNYFYLDDTD